MKSKSLTRKSKPVTGSLAAYFKDYKAEGFTKKQAMSMAQLAYAQDRIRNRLGALEAMSLAQVLGLVENQGNMHKLSCAKREDHDNACDCKVAGKETSG